MYSCLTGASHVDDIGYLFQNALTPKIRPGSIEDVSIDRIVKLWTNFAKYGNPTPKMEELIGVVWPIVTKDSMNYLEIGNIFRLGANPDQDRMDFWDQINKKYSKV